MSVEKTLSDRVSTRAFKDTAVPEALLSKIFSKAQLSPSNCNVQPWQTYVVSGDKKAFLQKALLKEIFRKEGPNPDFGWSVEYSGKHRERQFGSANALYSAMDISRENKKARTGAMLKNWEFFGAPHAAFFTMDKYRDIMGAVDLGIYAQSLALLLQEKGISSCFQGALAQYPKPARELFGLSEDQGILFGMSFGYAYEEAEVNQARTVREAIEDSVCFIT